MQVIDPDINNRNDIKRQIKLAISKVAAQLLEMESNDPTGLASIGAIYVDTLKILVNFPDTDVRTDLVEPLVKVVQKSQTPELLGLTGLVIFVSLVNESTFDHAMEQLGKPEFRALVPGFIEVLEQSLTYSDDSQVFSVNLLDSLIDMWSSETFRSALFNMSLNLFKFLKEDFHQLTGLGLGFIESLHDGKLETLSEKISECLEAILNNLIGNENSGIFAIFLYNSKYLEKINSLVDLNLGYSISACCKIINYMVVEILSGSHLGFKCLETSRLSSKVDNNQSLTEVSNKGLEFALQHLLRTLDSPEDISKKMIQVYIIWAHNEIISYCQLQYGKLNVYSMFNKLKPSISFLSVFQQLNFNLLDAVFKSQKVQVDKTLQNTLKQSKLPPYPKPAYFCDEYPNKTPSDFNLTEHVSDIEQLALAIVKSLKVISMFSQDDFSSFLSNNNEDVDLQKRTIVHKFERLLANLMISHYVFTYFQKIPSNFRHAATLNITNTLIGLLKLDFESIHLNQTFTWIVVLTSMMNFVVLNLKYLMCFNDLMEVILVEFKNDEIINDPAVKVLIGDFIHRHAIDLSKYPELAGYTAFEPESDLGLVTFLLENVKDRHNESNQLSTGTMDDSFSTNHLSNLSLDTVNSNSGSISYSNSFAKEPEPTKSYSRFQSQAQPFYPDPQSYPDSQSYTQFQSPSQSQLQLQTSTNQPRGGYNTTLSKVPDYTNGRQQSIHVDDFGK